MAAKRGTGTEKSGGAARPADGARPLIDLANPVVKYALERKDGLLFDRATRRKIVWATDSYSGREGRGFKFEDEITPDAVYRLEAELRPRAEKRDEERKKRSKERAEVFTPAWVCAYMNDYCDSEWLNRPGEPVFTRRTPEGRGWEPVDWRLAMPDENTRKKYVTSRRLEITCGEAPFIVSRCDAASGEYFPVRSELRAGALDRKLQVVSELVPQGDHDKWLELALKAFQSVYGYEFQGDSLLIARINLLLTFAEYYEDRFEEGVDTQQLNKFIDSLISVISWNFWQMDGHSCQPPVQPPPDPAKPEQKSFIDRGSRRNSRSEKKAPSQRTFFAPEQEAEISPVYALARDWRIRHSYPFNNFVKGEHKLKFDFIIGNPPYQEDVEGSTRTKPVYNFFMDEAYQKGDKVLLITPGRFLMRRGFTPEEWNEKMLSDPHLKVVEYDSISSHYFDEVDIKGGIAITYRDAKHEFGPIEVFFMFEELKGIYEKVVHSDQYKFVSIADQVYPYNKWNMKEVYAEYASYIDALAEASKDRLGTSVFSQVPIFTDEGVDDDVRVIGVVKNKRVYKYVKLRYVDQKHPNLLKYKVVVPMANGSGALGEVLSTPLLGTPLLGYTETFIGIGAFDTEFEGEAAYRYIKTKFARVMLGIMKVTQHNRKGAWKYVPLQDFTPDSDIDWTQSVRDIDRQLYRKYGLTQEEIDFIETKVREMI